MSAAEYKHILRIAGKDIEGSKKVIVALSKVKGIGYNFAHVLLQSLNINLNSRVGFLTDRELADIETAIKDPSRSRLPEWYWNRRKDMETGSHRHLITSDLDFMISNDIDREKTIMSWRGYRHMFGLRVRGQCTRTTGRKGGAVGVKKIGKPMPSAVSSTPSKGTGSGSATVTGEGASSIKPAAEAENANTTPKK
ncbi:MAG TPA: 30S ribosomal protein S13 [Nitrososphaeraceae archaeon]|nr:30S ribosomal protein S13 [Nitrososphaeraceae archaeon]